jgi:ATP-dependent Clp protease ATP-binding subunit ClpB
VELSDAARDQLGKLGYDPVYGARPLKRVIQRHLVDPLARGLLQGDFSGGDHVRVDATSDGELTFAVAELGAKPGSLLPSGGPVSASPM